jgi:hypothetical protein
MKYILKYPFILLREFILILLTIGLIFYMSFLYSLKGLIWLIWNPISFYNETKNSKSIKQFVTTIIDK